MRPPTIKDVAKHAQCGVATVSRVLNNAGSASEETRKRVLVAAKKLNFQFSDLGRSLQSKKTRTIGCIVPSLSNPVFAEAVQGVQSQADQNGYQLLLICTNYDIKQELAAVRTFKSKAVDAIVLTVNDTQKSPALDEIIQQKIPYCMMFNHPKGGLPSACVDNGATANEIASAFASKNHIHTGFLALKFKSSDRSRQRYEGFASACSKNKMAKPILLELDENLNGLEKSLCNMIKDNPKLTGLFASNDFLAVATIQAARKLGYDVPKDFSIVGFDGASIGEWIQPKLATIVTHPDLMGKRAAEHILSMLDADFPSPDLSLLPYEFRWGESLAAARKSIIK